MEEPEILEEMISSRTGAEDVRTCSHRTQRTQTKPNAQGVSKPQKSAAGTPNGQS